MEVRENLVGWEDDCCILPSLTSCRSGDLGHRKQSQILELENLDLAVGARFGSAEPHVARHAVLVRQDERTQEPARLAADDELTGRIDQILLVLHEGQVRERRALHHLALGVDDDEADDIAVVGDAGLAKRDTERGLLLDHRRAVGVALGRNREELGTTILGRIPNQNVGTVRTFGNFGLPAATESDEHFL